MLVRLLRSHPHVIANGEVMAFTDSLGGFDVNIRDTISTLGSPEELLRWRREDPLDFMARAAFESGDHAMVGFKMKSDELLLEDYQSILDALVADTELPILHLNRDNLFERFVSWVMVNRVTGVTWASREDQRPEFTSVEIDPAEVEADFDEATRRHGLVDDWFQNHRVLNVTYEGLVARPAHESSRICEFLGLPPRQLTTDSLKLTPHPSEVVANYDDIRRHFADGPYAELFSDPPTGR